jgi:hypothetical protein
VACTFRYSQSAGISPTLNWPEQAPSTKTRCLTGSHHHNACHVSIMSIISQEPKLGLSMHHVHLSKILLSLRPISPKKQVKARNISRAPQTTPPTRDSTLPSHQPTIHPMGKPHGLPCSTDHPNNQPSHHITRHICNYDGNKCKQAGRQYIIASVKLGSQG